MPYFFRKIHVAITTLLLLVTVQAHADYGNSSTCGECNFCSCAPACCVRGFISADLLYWKAHQSGFVCGCSPDEINNFLTTDGNVISNIRGSSRDPHFRWDSGFRIGTGYEFGCHDWDIAAYWTHFHTRTRHHHQSELNQFRWKLDYDVIDVVLGRGICAESFTFRPFIGVRIAQIDQKVRSNSLSKYNTFFDTSSFSSSSDISYESLGNPNISDFFLANENNRERFRGVGPLIGVEADWNLGCGLSLYASAAVSSLYGHFNVRFHGFNTFLNGTNTCHKQAHFHSCQISTDIALGIRWQQCFCNDMQVTFQLAWEQHRYFDHNHLGDYGDLCLQGVSFSAGVSF